MKGFHLALLIVMNLFWAGTYSAFKGLGELLTAGEVTTLRFSLATVLIGLLWPLLLYAFIGAWKNAKPRDRSLWIWITLVSWMWIILTALRGGGDMWDNPRYRAITLIWQALASGELEAHPGNLFASFPPLAQMLYAVPLAIESMRAPALVHLIGFCVAARAAGSLS